jgi:ADP-ribosylglycohydrolase
MLGAIIGDICGSIYEFDPIEVREFSLMKYGVDFTDDSVLTVAVADAILYNKDFAITIKRYAQTYPGRGYGGRFYDWIDSESLEPYGSYGNGSAMRVSAVGFYYDTVDEVLEKAKQSAEVTHNHKEGIKGAQAVALAIFLARTNHTKEEIKNEIETRFNYDLSRTLEEIEKNYSFNETCQGSVPEAIMAFLESTDFESAIKNAIWLKGDADTQACMAGAIAEAFYKEIPQYLKDKAFEIIPKEFKKIIDEFYIAINSNNNIYNNTIKQIQLYFHKLINERMNEFGIKNDIKLPELNSKQINLEKNMYFPINGMYGGFSYWFELKNDELELISESWSRIAGGSGERHIINKNGCILVDEGFV